MSYDDEREEECEHCEEYMSDCNCPVAEAFTNADQDIARLVEKLQVTPEVLRSGVEGLVKSLRESLARDVRASMLDVVKKECGLQAKALIGELLPGMLREVLEGKIFIGGVNSWDHKEISVKDQIRAELKDFVSKLESSGRKGETIREMVGAIMKDDFAQKILQAVEEIKKETIDQISKETMRSIVSTVAQQLAGDPKLVALMAPERQAKK